MASLEDKFKEHFETIQEKQQEVAQVLATSQSGQAVLEASQMMGATEEMQNVMYVFSDPTAHEVDRFTMARYFGEALEGEVETKIDKFLEYLESLAGNPEFQDRGPYYIRIRDAVQSLKGSQQFQLYINQYKSFRDDASEDAAAARKRIDEISQELRSLVSLDDAEAG